MVDYDIETLFGLTEGEAARRLQEDGYNELPQEKHKNITKIALEVLREPMFLLLVVCGVLYLLIGDVREAWVLLSFVFLVMGITFYQERKTERALEALRDLSSPRALVLREGEVRRISGREVVRGDILFLSEGDRVPADAVLLSGEHLSVDESILTGESEPVHKTPWDGLGEQAVAGGDSAFFVYAGTLVVQGQGLAKVVATGIHTEMGKIGRSLQQIQEEPTLLQQESKRVVRALAIGGLSLCFLLVIIYGFTKGDWLNGWLAGITMAMSILPEEIPVILTVFLSLGAWRMAKKKVLSRRMATIETLGAATVLCADKTGTLTLNRMAVQKVYVEGRFFDLQNPLSGDQTEKKGETPWPEAFDELVKAAVLACEEEPFDPMEKAILSLGERRFPGQPLRSGRALVRQYPLSRQLLAVTHVWQEENEEEYEAYVKGAPEAIAALCHLPAEEAQTITLRVNEMAQDGLRVLAVAKAITREDPAQLTPHDYPFVFLGLLGLKDPIRPTVPKAIEDCHRAGVRVIMITGDYPLTAQSIGRQIGLRSAEKVLTGAEIMHMSEMELRQRCKEVNIFARMVPEQKLRLVNALKNNGEVVAMTGDGVNDAPALKAAHIGIAMGGRGTDVAREAASLVILDDDFSSIVHAIRMGRRIYDNMKKALVYTLAVHVPIAGMSFLPVLMQWPLVLLPVHIVFLELIIDPACSVIFEAEREEKDVMERPPRKREEHVFNRSTVLLSLLQGGSVWAIVLGIFLITLRLGLEEGEARAFTFASLIIANLALIFTNRSWTSPILFTLKEPNPALWWVSGGALAVLTLVLTVPWLREIFRFSPLSGNDLLISGAAGIFSILWFEGLKVWRSKGRGKRERHASH